MAKKIDNCKLCGTRKLVNFAGLCKRCNQKKEGQKIIAEAEEKHHEEMEAMEAERKKQMESVEAAPVEETTEKEETNKEEPKEEKLEEKKE